MLAVGDNELIVGNDKLDVGDSKVASFGHSDVAEREAYKAAWARDPMNWLWFSGMRAKKHLIINLILLYLYSTH